MRYLRILDTIRSITGNRGATQFPAKNTAYALIDAEPHGPDATRVIFLYDVAISRVVLESDCFEQFDFLARAVASIDRERSAAIRAICRSSPLLLDGPLHRQRRQGTAQVLARCPEHLSTHGWQCVTEALQTALATDPPLESSRISEALVGSLFNCCFSLIAGREIALPPEWLFEVDFFNPFPSPSALMRCNDLIDQACRAIGWEDLDEAEQATVSALLVMGISPIHAMVTASINAMIEALRAGATPQDDLDPHQVVPTNFVMRRCTATFQAGELAFSPGDIIYVFLGSVSGCPFGRLTAVPFGAGRHYCSGARLSYQMLDLVNGALRERFDAIATVIPSAVNRRASAFLGFV